MSETERLPTIEQDGFIFGITLLINACGEKDDYDGADHVKAGLPMIMSCTRCQSRVAGGAAKLYPRNGSYVAYCGIC